MVKRCRRASWKHYGTSASRACGVECADLNSPARRLTNPTKRLSSTGPFSTLGTVRSIRTMGFNTKPNSSKSMCRSPSAFSWTYVSPSARGLVERDLLALQSPCEWCSQTRLRPRARHLRRFAPQSDRVPAGSCFRPNRLGGASCSLCLRASTAKSPLRLRSEFVLGDHEDRVRNGVCSINDSQITACVRLPEQDSHSSLSRSVFDWTIEDRLDFVFSHVMTAGVRLPTPRIIGIAYPHRSIVPYGREATSRTRAPFSAGDGSLPPCSSGDTGFRWPGHP